MAASHVRGPRSVGRCLALGRADPGSLAGWALPPLALVALTWSWSLDPSAGLDPSWHAGLAMAAHSGLGFGTHIDFTYGPLGFLDVSELYFDSTAGLAFAVHVLIQVALLGALYAAARSVFGRFAGFLIALVVGCTVTDPTPVIALAVALGGLLQRGAVRRLDWRAAALGLLGGLELLVKFSTGVQILAVALAFVLFAPARRGRLAAQVAGVGIVVFLAGWTLAGDPWSGLSTYVHDGLRLISGYPAAMSKEDPGVGWQLSVFALLSVGGLMVTIRTLAASPSRTRAGAAMAWLVFAFFAFKVGFTRHDATPHAVQAMSTLLAGLVLLPWGRADRGLALGLMVGGLAFVLASYDATIDGFLAPQDRASSALDGFRAMLSSGSRARIRDQGRALARGVHPLDGATLAAVGDHTVHVAPWEADVVWAYQLRWAPLPVFQAYTAYTTGLDRQNAATLNSPAAPERILVMNPAPDIDGRVSGWDEPLTTLTMLCRYSEIHTTAAWDVLSRGPERCGRARLIASVRAGWGQPVTPPGPPDRQSLVVARIAGVQANGLERLRSLLFKPYCRYISLNGTPHRLVPGTAGDGLVMEAPAAVDFAPPFEVAPNPRTISITRDGDGSGGGHPIRYDFYAVPVVVPPRAAPQRPVPSATAVPADRSARRAARAASKR